MRETLTLLLLEHGNLGKLLDLVDDQMAVRDGDARMDGALLRLASQYFADYPERCHHPKEDLLYERLRQRDPDACAGIHDLIADHRRLHELAVTFDQAVQRLGEGAQADESAARAAIGEFTRRYRQHLRDEEARFFPVAEERLTQADWDTLDFVLFDHADPLFDHVVEERFAALREQLGVLAAQSKARRSVIGAAKELRELSGPESFNESMRSAGEHFRLTQLPEGGYGLELESKLMLYIPECSPQRAAWCAYCFLCGHGWPWAHGDRATGP